MRIRTLERFRYWYENYLARGGWSIVISLVVLFLAGFLVMILLKAGVGLLDAATSAKPTLPRPGDTRFYWEILMQLMDTGTVGGAEGGWPRTLGLIATLIGVSIFSTFIAFISSNLNRRLTDFRQGISRVTERGHILILGWNERVIELLRQLILANEHHRRTCVVVLADRDKETMDTLIRTRFPQRRGIRIVTRRGNPASLTDLRRVNAAEARAALILAECSESADPALKQDSDDLVFKRIMALTACRETLENFPIVAEFLVTGEEEIRTYFPDVVSIDAWDILGKIFVTTSLTGGLVVVYNELFSFEGSEINIHEADWRGLPFGELVHHYRDGIPIGLVTAAGEIILRPDPARSPAPGERLLIISRDEASLHFSPRRLYEPGTPPLSITSKTPVGRRILILGWHHVGHIIVREYAAFLRPGSAVDIMHDAAPDRMRGEIATLRLAHPGIVINTLPGNPLKLADLRQAGPGDYDTVIILSPRGESGNPERTDTDTMKVLLLLRQLQGTRCRIITQILNPENQALITRTDVNDFIISNQIITMILAQLSQQPVLKRVYESLFREEGSELYSKPAGLYFSGFPLHVTFLDLLQAAAARQEICIGVRLGGQARNAAENYGIVLNPDKERSFTLDVHDSLIVLAEDEL